MAIYKHSEGAKVMTHLELFSGFMVSINSHSSFCYPSFVTFNNPWATF